MSNYIRKLAENKNNNANIVPSYNILKTVMKELSNIPYIPYGTVKIDKRSDNMFLTEEPGTFELCSVQTIKGVIIMSQDVRVCSDDDLGSGDGFICCSKNIITGMNHEGNLTKCSGCQFRKKGSDRLGWTSACKDWRILYILREGKALPTVLFLTHLDIDYYNQYRIQLASSGKLVSDILTKFTIDEHARPSYEAVSILSPLDVNRIKKYRDLLLDSSLQSDVYADIFECSHTLRIS